MGEPFAANELGHVAAHPGDRLAGRLVPRHVGVGQRGDRLADPENRARPNAAVDLLQFVAALLDQGRHRGAAFAGHLRDFGQQRGAANVVSSRRRAAPNQLTQASQIAAIDLPSRRSRSVPSSGRQDRGSRWKPPPLLRQSTRRQHANLPCLHCRAKRRSSSTGASDKMGYTIRVSEVRPDLLARPVVLTQLEEIWPHRVSRPRACSDFCVKRASERQRGQSHFR